MAELILGRLLAWLLVHWPTLILLVVSPFISLLFIEYHIFYHFKIKFSLYGRAGAGPIAWPAISTLANLNFDGAGPIISVFYRNTGKISIFGCTVSRPVYMAFPDSRGPGNPTGSAQCAGPGNGSSRHSVVPLCVVCRCLRI